MTMQIDEFKQDDAMNAGSVIPKVAIVAEGGGQRGIYTAGVLDSFLDRKFNPFQIGLGVSAGAQNLLTYFMGERGYAKRAISELTAAPGFFVPYRWLGARGVIDLDHYFDQTILDPEYRLPYQHISQVQKNRQLIFVATNRQTLAPAYLEPDKHTVIDYLKASSAVPFLYRAPVTVRQQQLVDGGVADPLPVLKAIEMGARQIVVIRTVGLETEQSSWRQRIDALPMRRALPKLLLHMLETHEDAYTQAINAIKSPPAGVNIISIAPKQPLHSLAFGSSSEAMVRDYAVGCSDGLDAIERVGQLLSMQTAQKQNTKKLRTLTDSIS